MPERRLAGTARSRVTLVVAALIVCLAACGKENADPGPPQAPPPSPSPPGQARNSRILSLTTLHTAAARPRFAPDGRSFVFDRLNGDGYYDLYVSDLQGAITLSVTEGRAGITQRNNGNGIFHPQGNFVVFVSEVPSHFLDELPATSDPGIGLFSNLWAFDVRSSGATQLTSIPIKRDLADPTPAMAVVNPVFSPDGAMLLWTERFSNGGHYNWGSWRLKAADFDLTSGNPVLRNERVLYAPAAGNYVTAMAFLDATNLLVAGNLEGQHEYGMDQYVVNLATQQLRNLTRTPTAWEEGSCVAPNRTIAFMSNVDSKVPLDFGTPDWVRAPIEREYYVTDESGSGTERWTYFNDPGAPEYQSRRTIVAACSFSPDGAYMAATIGSDRRSDQVADIELKIVLFAFRTPLRLFDDTRVAPSAAPPNPDDPAGTDSPAGVQMVYASGSELEPRLTQIEDLLERGELDIVRVQADTMLAGRTHERIEQRYKGLPVFGGQVVRQTEGRHVLSLSGRLYEGIAVANAAGLSQSAAEAIASERAGANALVEPKTTLGILPLGLQHYRLSYEVRVRTPDDIQVVFVDASSGQVLREYSDLRSMFPARQPWRSARFSPRSPLIADFRQDTERLGRFILAGELYPSDEADAVSPVTLAVRDRHQTVDQYLFARFGRRGFDDNGGAARAILYKSSESSGRGTRYLGAGAIVYGDTLQSGMSAGLSLDAVAHELTHAVIEYSSMLAPIGQPAAVAEGFADIVAAGLSQSWTIGEELTGSDRGRSLVDPMAAGGFDHYSSLRSADAEAVAAKGGGIMSHAFYLAVAGGAHRLSGIRVDGVGAVNMARIERIFYRAVVFFLGPHSGLIEARKATDQAALELYGPASPERTSVAQAWSAVGVF